MFSVSATASANNIGGSQAEKDTPEQHLIKAREAYQAKNYSLVKKRLKQALSLNGEMPEAHVLLGLTARAEGDSKEAIKSLDKAIKLRPNFPDAHYILALFLFEINDRARALEEAELAIAQGASFLNAFYLRGQIYLAYRKSQEALKSFEEGLRLGTAKDEMLPRLREQYEALKGWIEFTAVKRDTSYKRPKLLNNPFPAYTEWARQEGVEGTVRLAVLIDDKGKVTSSLIFLGLGYGLDEQAVKAASKFKFEPATVDGKPISFWQMVEVEFRLR